MKTTIPAENESNPDDETFKELIMTSADFVAPDHLALSFGETVFSVYLDDLLSALKGFEEAKRREDERDQRLK